MNFEFNQHVSEIEYDLGVEKIFYLEQKQQFCISMGGKNLVSLDIMSDFKSKPQIDDIVDNRFDIVEICDFNQEQVIVA